MKSNSDLNTSSKKIEENKIQKCFLFLFVYDNPQGPTDISHGTNRPSNAPPNP
jgi:hypothetical protein